MAGLTCWARNKTESMHVLSASKHVAGAAAAAAAAASVKCDAPSQVQRRPHCLRLCDKAGWRYLYDSSDCRKMLVDTNITQYTYARLTKV